jgi:hypothetical protein
MLTVNGRTDEYAVAWTVALSSTLAQYSVVAVGAVKEKVASVPTTPVSVPTTAVSDEQVLLVPL